MTSCGLEVVNEPLEKAAGQLSSDSLRDHRKRTLPFEFFKGEIHLSRGICLTTNSLWKIDDVSTSSSLPKILSAIKRLFESFVVALH